MFGFAAAVVSFGEGDNTSASRLGLSRVSRRSSRNCRSPQTATMSG